jgi:predicted lipoprotein with Yx(FWY)xxD motif
MDMSTKRRIVLASIATAAGLGVAACSSGGSGGARTPRPRAAQVPVAATEAASAASSAAPALPPAPPPAAPPAVSPSSPATARPNWKGWLVLSVARNDTVGTTVVDGKGFTLYRFDRDTSSPSVSNCAGACAKAWPPVRFTPKLRLKGIGRRLIGNIMTKDGICQATLGGRPLYRYGKDTGPGQSNGQGVGGTWFAVAPDGSKAGGGTAPLSPPAATPPSPGY